jgi:UDP-N-acetyl-D-glucosamine dehydrogenase
LLKESTALLTPQSPGGTHLLNKKQTLKQRLSEGEGVVAVIGVGYVGLPLAVELAKNKPGRHFSVIGADINEQRIKKLEQGKSTIEGVRDEDVAAVVGSERLKPLYVFDHDSSEPEPRPAPEVLKPLVGADVFVVCVPTPLHPEEQWRPDVRWIEKAAKLLRHVFELEAKSDALPDERLIVLESTSYPGTTRKFFGGFIDEYRERGKSWYLAYSPERTNPGFKNPHEADPSEPDDMFKIKRVVGGQGAADCENAVVFYQKIFSGVEPVDSLETAEMIKLVENTFRFVSIGFANEMARIAKSFGLNIWNIIEVAKTKKFGLDLCYPGLVGGHCIPIDPHYLNWAVHNLRQTVAFIDVAEKAHQEMKREAFDLVQRLLNQNNRGISGSSILFLGVAYKKNVADTRESAALDVMKRLYSSGGEVFFWDPVRASHTELRPVHLEFTRDEFAQLPPKIQGKPEPRGERYYLELSGPDGTWEQVREDVLSTKYDCVVISTDHDAFHEVYEDLIAAQTPLPIADLRNAIEPWLKQWVEDRKMTVERANELRQMLSPRSKYMLIGVH